MWKKTLCAAAFHELRNAMLSHLNEDGLEDDGKPVPNFSLEAWILEPSDGLSCEGLHNSELPQRMEYR